MTPYRSVLATANITIPATNTLGGALSPQHTGISIPANKWYRIRVSGNVNISVNPEYQSSGYYDPANPIHAGKSVDPLGIDGGSALRVGLGVQLADGSYAPISGTTLGDTTVLSAFVNLPQSGTLMVSRNESAVAFLVFPVRRRGVVLMGK